MNSAEAAQPAMSTSLPAADLLPISVRALCDFGARAGDLDVRFTPAPTALEGAEGHRRVQARRGAGYESEIVLRTKRHGLLVRGRADGFQADAGRLEEIKTLRGALQSIRANRQALHWAQAKVYGAMLCEERALAELDIALVYLDLQTDTETPVVARFTAAQLADHADALCQRLARWAAQERQRLGALHGQLSAMRFPQAEFRTGQRPFAAAVYQTVRDGGALLAQAPTGIGKTLASIFPALKAKAQARVDKFFYLTAKTPGRAVALQALRSLHDQAPGLRVVELSARERACVHPGRACHGDDCPLARGFFDRLEAARQAAADACWLDQEAVARIAARHSVCPYYLSQEMIRWADVVVADYNHYFDGSAMLFAMAREEGWRVALLIDEAHNILDRGRAMYSCALDGPALERARSMAPPAVAVALNRVAQQWSVLGEGAAEPAELTNRSRDAAALGRFRSQVPATLAQAIQQAVAALSEHFAQTASGPSLALDGPLQRSFFDLLQLDRLIEGFDQDSLLEVTGDPRSGCLALRNLVPAACLRGRWAAAHACIAFSATMTPFEFYRDTLGMPARTRPLDVPSPFGEQQLSVHIAQGMSGRARHRHRVLPSLVRAVTARFRAQPGNYLVFLGSLAHAQTFAAALARAEPDLPMWVQVPAMGDAARTAFLGQFASGGQGVGVAVLGGAFGEGVDLPGDRLIGVFIAGLGLAPPDAFNEQVRKRMQERFGRGYDYTYLYPGLQKVAQAAGRADPVGIGSRDAFPDGRPLSGPGDPGAAAGVVGLERVRQREPGRARPNSAGAILGRAARAFVVSRPMRSQPSAPMLGTEAHLLDPAAVRDISSLLLDDHQRLRVVPARVLKDTTPQERMLFGVRHGVYGLPTEELVAFLRARIGGRRAIEIGAGHGVLAHALGIPATDNRQQEEPAIQAHYAALGQPTVPYGPHVEKLDAANAVRTYRPSVVIACWVTHRFDPDRPHAGGSATGVDEAAVIASCDEYIFVGNEHVHARKPIWALPHEVHTPAWIYSRAVNGSRDFVAVWRRDAAAGPRWFAA